MPEVFLDSNIQIKSKGKVIEIDVMEASERLSDLYERFPGKENRIEWYNGVKDYMAEIGFEGKLSNGAALNFFKVVRSEEEKLEKKLSDAFPQEQK